jgi:hypothetical protein
MPELRVTCSEAIAAVATLLLLISSQPSPNQELRRASTSPTRGYALCLPALKELNIMAKLTLVAIFLLLPSAAFGQEYDSRWEVFGTLGYGGTWDDEGGVGRGLDIGGGLGVRATRKLGFEGSINRIRHLRKFSTSPVRFEGTAVFASANALYHFSESSTQPYVIGGVGALWHEDRSSGLGPVRPPLDASGFAYNFGGGVKFFLSKHVSLRPEFRIFIGDLGVNGGVEPPFSLMRGSIGVSYHW